MDDVLSRQVAAVRRFNRFYTRRIGVLQEHLARSPFSLAEARVVYELAVEPAGLTATDLQERLSLDAGYLSRILKRLEKDGFIERRAAADDGRRRDLWLTAAGRAAFEALDRAAEAEVGDMLLSMPPPKRERVAEAVDTIERALGPSTDDTEPLVLRGPEPGDLGWIVQRHAALYAREYRFDATFEALVMQIVAAFADGHDPMRERVWIAERAGSRVGSVMLVAKDEATAKLRLLLVEPQARGLGVGRNLVERCLRFARRVGYRRIELWTNDVLTEARRLYETAGFEKVASEAHRSFGCDLVGETWVREL